MHRTRHGSILTAAASILAVLAALGMALTIQLVRSSRTAAYDRDHLALRLLAESGAEELAHALCDGANRPGDPTYAAVRLAGAAIVELPWLTPRHVLAELDARARELGALIAPLPPRGGGAWVKVMARTRVSADPAEVAASVVIEFALSLSRSGRTTTERVVVERVYQIARATCPRMPPVPAPSQRFSMLVTTSERATLPNIAQRARTPGPPAFVAADNAVTTRIDGGHKSLYTALTSRPPDGFSGMHAATARSVHRELEALSSASLARRAQLATARAADLLRYLDACRRADRPVLGLIWNASTEPMRIDLASFRGRCTIVSQGPIEVGDVRLAAPSRDELTLVSAARIVVSGRIVEAGLVCHGTGSDGVWFTQTAEVFGPVITDRFPRAAGMSGSELGRCAIGANAALPPGRDLAWPEYPASFSPYPNRQEHARE